MEVHNRNRLARRPDGRSRLHETGGKRHATLAEALRAYIDAAGIDEDRRGWLFRTARGHNGYPPSL